MIHFRFRPTNLKPMLRSNHLVQTVRTTFPAVQTVPFTFPLGISHLHLWRSGDGFSDSVCTAGKKKASLHRKPYIIALQLQLCTWREPSYSRITHARRHCWSGGLFSIIFLSFSPSRLSIFRLLSLPSDCNMYSTHNYIMCILFILVSYTHSKVNI